VLALLVAGPALRAQDSAGPASGTDYEIRAGDTLWEIARRTGCSADEIRRANDLEGDRIVAGRRLRIPSCGAATAPAPGRERAATTEAPAAPRMRTGLYGTIDTTTLPRLLAARGFVEPAGGFKAYVAEIRFASGRDAIAEVRRFDHRGTSGDARDWNAASTVKLYAAIAAMLRARDLGCDPDARLVFDAPALAGASDPSFTLRELVEAAVGPSDNLAYDYLAVFTGFDRLNETFFARDNGFIDTALRLAYQTTEWEGLGFEPYLRPSPAIRATCGGETIDLPASRGRAVVTCSQATCTSLEELGETLRRVMLQEILPDGEHFALQADDLELLRGQLATVRARGEEVVTRLRAHFGPEVRTWHKAGYSRDWYSDNVYLDDPERDRAWIVALAGNPGRDSLNEAADRIGGILAEGI
jgi:hypothetical protein